jgi:type II secretory pathway predicted ATPase ExeA
VDPFALTCNPGAYVARPACEAALGELERCVRKGGLVALSGPPGIGKTLVLRVLERRLAGALRCVSVPYAALAFEELCQWVLGLMEQGTQRAARASAELAALACRRADAGEPLLLLLDDAGAIPPATLRALLAWAAQQGGAVRLLFVPVDDSRSAQVLAALGPDVAHVRLVDPMSAAETERYVAARLAQAGALEAALEHLGPGLVRWLHRESGGIPRRLHQLVAWVLHREGPAPDTATPFAASGPWLELDPEN